MPRPSIPSATSCAGSDFLASHCSYWASLLPLRQVPSAQSTDPPELRALWADAFHDGFKSPEQVDALVAWARAANLNALFVQVRRRGDAYYVSSVSRARKTAT